MAIKDQDIVTKKYLDEVLEKRFAAQEKRLVRSLNDLFSPLIESLAKLERKVDRIAYRSYTVQDRLDDHELRLRKIEGYRSQAL